MDKVKTRLTELVREELDCCDDPDPRIQMIDIPRDVVKFDGYCASCLDRFGGETEFSGVEMTR